MRGQLTPTLRIAAEGWFVLVLLLLAAALAAQAERWWLLTGLLGGITVAAMFFHDAPRHTVAKPLGVLAPLDGSVVFRRECHDPFLGREAIRIGIAVPWFSNYLLRAPVEGEVRAVDREPRQVSCLTTDEGEAILVVAGRGLLLGMRPIWAAYGERVGQGRACGARRLLRQIDVYLPAGCRVEVTLGQTVRCGETVLATLLRRSA